LSDLVKLAKVVANYTSGSSFTNRLPHLKVEEVFGSFKQPANYPLDADNDSYHPNCVNFFCP
jgi:hypothetical protein